MIRWTKRQEMKKQQIKRNYFNLYLFIRSKTHYTFMNYYLKKMNVRFGNSTNLPYGSIEEKNPT